MNKQQTLPVGRELPRPLAVDCPYDREYVCDVVVLGCGFAGLNAAVTARENGSRVLVVDKGRPGYSGLSPWANSFRWFDPEKDNAEAFRKAILKGGEYIANMDWYECWIRESKAMFHRLTDWGILAQYPRACDAGDFYEREDFAAYREAFERFDRHQKWVEVLQRYDIPYLQHTMVTHVIRRNGGAQGVMGFHVPSGQVITVHAKAVVMAMGGGCYKPSGFPAGGNTFDGEYIAYQLGLPIAGKEFEDPHGTSSVAPGSPFYYTNWPYLENFWLCGGDATEDNQLPFINSKAMFNVTNRIRSAMNFVPASDGTAVTYEANTPYLRRAASVNYGVDPDEIRSGKKGSPIPSSDLPGGAIGMGCHLNAGVLCALDDLDGATAVAGLFVAGDGIHATAPGGAAYPCGRGFTSCFCSIDGDHAGRAAAAYAAEKSLEKIPESVIAQHSEEILAPLRVERGVDANWLRDILHHLMAPYWVTVLKTETMLKAVLTQVEYMRDHVVPHLQACSSHDLRLCHEMKHKVLSAEMKLRASLARKESRGATYRVDHPYRDDDNFLCYMTVRKADSGDMAVEKTPVKEAWTGDRTLSYEKRYSYYYPGEPEVKGFTPPPEPTRRR